MDKNARLDTYLELLQPSLPQYLEEIEKYAHEEDVPIIRKPTQHFFRVFLSILNPKRILEIGTAIGFSALYMMENSSSDTTIDTIENYPPRIEVATKNISNSSYGDRINLIKGDAMEILPTLDSKYDLIADIDGKLIRVQVKTSSPQDEDAESISFSCRSTHKNFNGVANVRYKAEDVDYFATYWNNQVFLVPIAECSTSKTLRIVPPKNGHAKWNLASDYELGKQLQKIKEEVAEH
jgi:hypothetical protein